MDALIHFNSANIGNGDTPVVYGLNMDVFPGDLLYIVGKVGSGKTSIIRTITAENKLLGGEASVCGFNLAGIRRRDIPMLRRRLGIVFQDFQLLMDRSVEDNLYFVLRSTGWKDKGQMDQRICEVLAGVGMETKAHKMPHQLSGGEQQRMLNKPEVILADEPTGNLDEETAEGILELLKELNAKGTSIVMVTHNMSILYKFPGRVFVCEGEHCTEQYPDGVIRVPDSE